MTEDAGATRTESRGQRAGGSRKRLGILWVHPHDTPSWTPLEGSSITLGRSREANVVLETEGTSRLHARIVHDPPLWTICDLGSRNGLYVNGALKAGAPLADRTIVRLGGTLGVVVDASLLESHVFRELAPGLFGGGRLGAIVRQALKVAPSLLPVIIEAPTGCGKERFARAIHQWSGRKGEFVAVNCAALPENLAEAELFGYRKGAFTGALRDHEGYFAAADRGTLLLDEVVDLPPSVQGKLLRVVEQKEVIPLGSTTPRKVDVRLISAAQVPLLGARGFREDLYARLSGVTLRLPPLRERIEDVPHLFRWFMQRSNSENVPRLDTDFVEKLCLHHWPLNVRELESLAGRLKVLFAHESTLRAHHLDHQLSARVPPESGLSEVELDWKRFLEALKASSGNVVKAARQIGVSRQRAYRLLSAHPTFDVSALRRPGAQ